MAATPAQAYTRLRFPEVYHTVREHCLARTDSFTVDAVVEAMRATSAAESVDALRKRVRRCLNVLVQSGLLVRDPEPARNGLTKYLYRKCSD